MCLFARVPVSTALTKLQNHGELLNRIIYLFYVFSRPFDLAKGNSVVDMSRYIETLYRGKMEHGTLG